MKHRLDQAVVGRGLTATRSQAESWIRLGKVFVNGHAITKPGYFVVEADRIKLKVTEQYVSRAALKLASVAKALKVEFKGKIVLDIGSSTGGFTEFALRQGAKRVIAVDVGTGQLHPSLRRNERINLYEKTDIRDVFFGSAPTKLRTPDQKQVVINDMPNIVVADVSFISLRDILPHIADVTAQGTQIVAMVKPQFEAGASQLKHKGVIKNDRMRRDILKDFESWVRQYFVVLDKADSEVAGSKGNLERFYLLKSK